MENSCNINLNYDGNDHNCTTITHIHYNFQTYNNCDVTKPQGTPLEDHVQTNIGIKEAEENNYCILVAKSSPKKLDGRKLSKD